MRVQATLRAGLSATLRAIWLNQGAGVLRHETSPCNSRAGGLPARAIRTAQGTQADREKLERNAERLGLNLSDYIVSTISRHRAWDLPRLAPHLKDLLHGVNTHGRLD